MNSATEEHSSDWRLRHWVAAAVGGLAVVALLDGFMHLALGPMPMIDFWALATAGGWLAAVAFTAAFQRFDGGE